MQAAANHVYWRFDDDAIPFLRRSLWSVTSKIKAHLNTYLGKIIFLYHVLY